MTISGSLGSGKSSLAAALAERFGTRRVGTGELHRSIAEERGVSTLELNRLAESDQSIDHRVDSLLREMGATDDPLVVDSRMAWYFMPDSLKVHLIVNPEVAAQRVLHGRSEPVEGYASVEHARDAMRARSESERRRFAGLYGVDINRLRNYDLVCDTTSTSLEEVVEQVESFLGETRIDTPVLLLDPRNVYPTQGISGLRGLWEEDEPDDPEPVDPIRVGYTHPHSFVVDGHRRLSRALQRGAHLIEGHLQAEDGEVVIAGISADTYFQDHAKRSVIYDWESVHEVALPQL